MKMKLFIWKGVLFDYTDGVVFALAKSRMGLPSGAAANKASS
jgi:hypothetical protein